MFSKRKKKLAISDPQNFVHRVHTDFDQQKNKFVGLPKQWAGIVTADSKKNRPTPVIDPSEITPTEMFDLKVKYKTQNVG